MELPISRSRWHEHSGRFTLPRPYCPWYAWIMDGFDNLVDALERFERSLESSRPIVTVKDLARESGYSTHHFSRLFSSHTGLRLKEYLQGRLLACLMQQAAHGDNTLASLSLQYGFKNYETFYRACRRQFGSSPRNIRLMGTDLQQRVHPIRSDQSGPLACSVVNVPSFTICGLSFYCGPKTRSLHTCWQQFSSCRQQIHAPLEGGTCYQHTAWLEDAEDGMSVLCGLHVDEEHVQESVFTARTIPESRYIRFIHDRDVRFISQSYEYIYGMFFATSEYQPLGNWEFQRYPPQHSEIEIFIPIRK